MIKYKYEDSEGKSGFVIANNVKEATYILFEELGVDCYTLTLDDVINYKGDSYVL